MILPMRLYQAVPAMYGKGYSPLHTKQNKTGHSVSKGGERNDSVQNLLGQNNAKPMT